MRYTKQSVYDNDKRYNANYRANLIITLIQEIEKDMGEDTTRTWLFISIVSNGKVKSSNTLRKAISHIQHNIEQRIFQNKAKVYNNEFDYQNSFMYYGFYEKGSYEDNPHYHLLMRIDENRVDWLKRILPKFVDKALPGASVDIQDIGAHGQGVENLVKYVTKEYLQNKDDFIISEKSSKRESARQFTRGFIN